MHDAQLGAGATGVGGHELWDGSPSAGANDSVSEEGEMKREGE